jgi:hypothetical protein
VSGLSLQPWLHQHSTEVQRFGIVRQFPLGLVDTPLVRADVPA